MSRRSPSRRHLNFVPTEFVIARLLREAETTEDIAALMSVDVIALNAGLRDHRAAVARGQDLHSVASRLFDGLCTREVFGDYDPCGVIEEALDELARINNCMFDSDQRGAPEEFVAVVDASLNGVAQPDQFDRWVRRYLLPLDEEQSWEWDVPTEKTGSLRAVILGPMTAIPTPVASHLHRLAVAAVAALEALGFEIHCPMLDPSVGADRYVAGLDADALAGATLVVAFCEPPALGVGIGVGATVPTRTPVLILGPPGTDISPLTGLLDQPVLLPAATPAQVTGQITAFLRANLARIHDHAMQLEERRRTMSAKFERFKLGLALEENLPDGLLPLSADYKARLGSDIDIFLTATAADIDAYLAAVEDLVSDDSDQADESIDSPPDVPSDEMDPHVGSQASDVIGAALERHRSERREPDEYRSAGFPPLGHPAEESEQLTLFGVNDPVRRAAPRQSRPLSWRDTPMLSLREATVGLRVIRELDIDDVEADRLLSYAVGLRCDQQLLAANGGGRSYVPLYKRDQWCALLDDMRRQ
jgi:hypothetical protein